MWELRGEESSFFDFCDEGRLMIQRCQECHAFNFPPRPLCPECGSRDLDWHQSKGTGEVHTYSVETGASDPDGGAPYVVAIVELDEGVRMMSNILDSPTELKVGSRVEVQFREFGGRKVPVFVRSTR